MQSLFKISITILGAALCGCSAVDRIQNIGSTPKLAPVGNPAEQQDRGLHSRASAHHPYRQFLVAGRRQKLFLRIRAPAASAT